MKYQKQIVIIGGIIAGVALVTAGGVFGIKKRIAATNNSVAKHALHQSARPVSIVKVKDALTKQEHKYPGVVQASKESALSFRVGGPLAKLNFILGEQVAKGTLLMQIDPRDYKDKIISLEAQLKGAEAMLLNAQQEYKRTSNLFKEKVVPQSAYDRAAGLKDAAAAAVATLNAQLQIEHHELEDTSLSAPYDGIVFAQFSEKYEMVNPGEVVLGFHNIEKLEVVINIPENDIVKRDMLSNKTARISFSAIPNKKYEIQLKEWSHVANPITRTYAVTFEFDAPSDIKILPGMSATVVWFDLSKEMLLTVPAAAITSDAMGNSILWLYDKHNSNATSRIVETGAFSGSDQIVILSGVTAGEKIIVDGSRLINKKLQLKPFAKPTKSTQRISQ